LVNRPRRIQKEGTAGRLKLLCLGCTLVVQCERTVVLQSAEMRNLSAAECGKAIRGNLRNVPHLIFRKLPLDSFPHSTNTRACIRPVRPVWPVHGSYTGRCVAYTDPALQQAEMRMVSWICDVKVKDKVPSKELRERLGIDDIILVLQQNRL